MEPFNMHCIEINGTPRERGLSHGQQMRTQINAIIDYGRESLQKAGGPPLEAIGAAFIQSTAHLQAARKWTPELVEELEGIAEGSGVDFGVLWASQCQDESYWFSTGQLGQFPPRPNPDRCSSLGVPALDGRPTLLAQNLDTPTLYNGYQTLLHIHYPGTNRQAYVVTEPGLVGICGLNSSPLGVCQNTLALKLNYDPGGVPAMLVARHLIDHPDLDSAWNFLHEVPHASGINYMLADETSVEDYECSPGGAVWYQHGKEGSRVAHTNHPLVSKDHIQKERLSEDFRQLFQKSNVHSTYRLGCLERTFYQAEGVMDVESIQRVLSSHEPPEFPVCRHKMEGEDIMRGMTNNSLVMVMSRPAEMHLTSGPPCMSEYRKFSF